MYLKDILAIMAAYEQAEAVAGDDAAFAAVREHKGRLNLGDIRRDVTDLLAESKDGLARVSRIVQDLRVLSHVSESAWEKADLHQGLDSTLNIVWNELKYHCTVHKNYATLPRITCLPSQLNQVFMNLLVNAGQAIEGQGEITIATECVGDASVRVRISDNGAGMAPEVLTHIFDPFYTTKPVGKGTGLGLSLAGRIVERHEGKIEVTSSPGQGSTFTVTLPVMPQRALAGPP